MNNKNTFFNLMKEDIKHRLSIFAISCLSFFFVYPVAALLIISYSKQVSFAENEEMLARAINITIIDTMKVAYGDLHYDVTLLAFLAIFASISGFYYLMNSNASDYYHSLPCKRGLLFWVNVLDGALLVIIPCILFEVCAAVILSAKISMAYPFSYLMGHLCENLVSFLLMYAVAILAIMLTGRFFTAICGITFLWSAASGMGTLFFLLANSYFDTFYSTDIFSLWTKYLSPFALAYIDKGVAISVLCLAATVAILLLDLWLYKKRPLEAAGKSFVFEKTFLPIKILVVVPSALSGALFMKSITGNNSWAVFGILCGLLIVNSIMEVLHYNDFKKLFANPLQLVFVGVLAFVIFAVYALDLTGYDKYTPKEDQLESTGIVCYDLEENLWELATRCEYQTNVYGEKTVEQIYGFDEMNYLDKARITNNNVILSLAKKAIVTTEENAKEDASFFDEMAYEDEKINSDLINITLAYHLKNGKTVYRLYTADKQDVMPELTAIYEDANYKNAVYELLTEDENNVKQICVENMFGRAFPNIDEAESAKLASVYKKELADLSMDTRRNESPLICVQFRTKEQQEMYDVLINSGVEYTDFFWEGQMYPVYPSFTGTLELLKNAGIDTDNILSIDDVSSMEVVNNNESTQQLIVTDKAQQEELFKNAVNVSLPYTNGMRECVPGLEIQITVTPEKISELINDPMYDKSTLNGGRTCYYNIPDENIPAFISEWQENADSL